MGKWKQGMKLGLMALTAAMMIASGIGTGTSYAAEASSEVPQVVEQTTPAVVAIIGKPSSGEDKDWEKNRYNLAHGTGVIVGSDGVIVTNAHVVKDMKNIVVVTSDGKTYNGKATNIDEDSDLALVKIEASGLPTVTLASSSDIEVGETVAAIGTPISFALRNSVTVGIVSGIDRSVNSQYQLIQTDAAINPGNSGGALINMKGELIGINTMKYADLGVENLGFAIPVDTVKYVLNHFKLYGKVKRPYLGLELEESWEALVGLPSSEGLRVAYVDPDSPAAEAGIKQDDVLMSIGGTTVKTMVDYHEALKNFLPGQTVNLGLQSGGAAVTKILTLGEVQSKAAELTQDADGSDLDADRGKTRIGDSHFGWSMKYPSGLVKSQQSDTGDSVSFMDAKGDFYLSIQVEEGQSDQMSGAALLNKLAGEGDDDYSGSSMTILERQYVEKEDGLSYGKLVARSGDRGYVQARAFLHQGRLYTISMFVTAEKYMNNFKQSTYTDLLDSFQLSFDSNDTSLKDISVYSDGNTTYTNEYGLSFDLPSDWKSSSYYGGNSSFHNDDYSQTVRVNVTSAASGDTMKAWFDREVKQFESGYAADYRKVSEPEELTVGGIPAIGVTTSYTLGDEWTSQYSLFFMKDTYKYEIEVSYPKADEAEVGSLIAALKDSIRVDEEQRDQELGYIQDLDELLDPDRTLTYSNDKYKYTLQIPEVWQSSPYDDETDAQSKSFDFNGGSLTVLADTSHSYEELVKDEDAAQKKSGDNDSEYTYTAEETSLFGETAKKYVVHYSAYKVPYQEVVYIFNHNQISYTVTLRMDEAVRTEENEARLNKAFESMQFKTP